MKDFRDWAASYQEAYPTTPSKFGRVLQNIGHRIMNPTQGNIDWNTIDQNAKQAAERDEPAIRQQKEQLLYNDFVRDFHSKVKLNGKDVPIVDRALGNIAKAFTLGYQLPTTDVHAILLAIHRAKQVPPEMKTEIFPDHYRLIAFFRQIFDHDPKTWYTPNAKNPRERFPPHFNVSEPELETYYSGWRKSPYNFKNVQKQAAASPATAEPAPQKPEKTVVDQVVDMMHNRANMPYSALEAMADALYDAAVKSGLPVEYGDKQKLRDAANGGLP